MITLLWAEEIVYLIWDRSKEWSHCFVSPKTLAQGRNSLSRPSHSNPLLTIFFRNSQVLLEALHIVPYFHAFWRKARSTQVEFDAYQIQKQSNLTVISKKLPDQAITMVLQLVMRSG